jgi:hypothetical protein
MQPPWLKYPDMPMGSLAWRMGHGEEYWVAFDAWFAGLSLAEKETFAKRHPSPPSFSAYNDYYGSRGVRSRTLSKHG